MLNHPVIDGETVIAFIDLQEGIINVAETVDRVRLRTCVGALAQLAHIFSIPVAVSCVPTTSGAVAPLLAEIDTRFPEAAHHVRQTANAMDDAGFRAALEASGRRTLVIAGVASEVAVALAAMAAQRAGYEVVVAVDACGGLDTRAEAATFTRLSALGITLSSVPAIAAELAGEFAGEKGRAAMRALQSTLDSHAHHAASEARDHDHTHE